MKSLICLMFLGASIALYAEDIEKEQEAKQKEAAAEHALFIALEKATAGTVIGTVYLGKGMFYVVFKTVKLGLKVTKAVVIGIPKTMLKLAFLMSGGYILLTAWSLAQFLGLRNLRAFMVILLSSLLFCRFPIFKNFFEQNFLRIFVRIMSDLAVSLF